MTGEVAAGVPATVRRLAMMVRKARTKKGWSQSLLAETVRVDRNVISRLEAAQSDPPFSLVADLARVLDLSVQKAVFNRPVTSEDDEEE
jgi:ribosome-binding protein aMBF1 (putative translation factor)